MLYFLTIIAFDWTKVTCRPVQTISIFIIVLFLGLTKLSCIDSCGGGGAFLAISAVLLALLFFLFAGFFGGLSLLLRSGWFRLLGLGPRFLYPWIFHGGPLALSLSGSRMGWSTTPVVLVRLPGIGARPESGLGFDVDGFFYKLFETIKFAAALFYLGSNWRFETLSKVSNHSIFFGGPVSIKFW